MRLPSLPYLLSSYRATFSRFPAAIAISIIATVCAMCLIEKEEWHLSDEQMRWIFKTFLGCILLFPLFIANTVLGEKHGWNLTYKVLTHLLILAVIGAYIYWDAPSWSKTDPSYPQLLRYFLMVITSHLIVTFIGYLRDASLSSFWEFNRVNLIHFANSTLYAVIIFAGLSLALLAMDELFNVNLDNEIYLHLFFSVAGIFHTSFFLTQFPKTLDLEPERGFFQKPMTQLVKFVLIPLVILYFFILYAFSSKILLTWTLPEGWVSKLVIGFSAAGILTYLLNYILPELDDSPIFNKYRKWFFYAVLPMVVLLFVAILRRTDEYGFTENRYYVVLTGIWLTFICLYFIISKKDDIRIIPTSLACFILISVVGPWSAFTISKNSQISRLERLLTEQGILQAGRITPKNPVLTGEAATGIYESIYYLMDHHYTKALGRLIPLEKEDDVASVLEKLGVENSNVFIPETFYSFRLAPNENLPIEGYSTLFHFLAQDVNDLTRPGVAFGQNRKSLLIKLESEDITFDLSPYFEKWINTFGERTETGKVGDLTLAIDSQRTLIFKIVEFQKIRGTWDLRYAEGYILSR